MASKQIINRVKDFANEVNACGISLKKVVLFGSYANGKYNRYSDIDVALVADEFTGVPSEDVKLFLKALRKYYIVQPQTYNTKDFSADKNPFVEEILKTGVEIKM